MAKPIEMVKVTQEGNARTLKRKRAYFKNNVGHFGAMSWKGKEALNYLLSQDRLRHPILFEEQGVSFWTTWPACTAPHSLLKYKNLCFF